MQIVSDINFYRRPLGEKAKCRKPCNEVCEEIDKKPVTYMFNSLAFYLCEQFACYLLAFFRNLVQFVKICNCIVKRSVNCKIGRTIVFVVYFYGDMVYFIIFNEYFRIIKICFFCAIIT